MSSLWLILCGMWMNSKMKGILLKSARVWDCNGFDNPTKMGNYSFDIKNWVEIVRTM